MLSKNRIAFEVSVNWSFSEMIRMRAIMAGVAVASLSGPAVAQATATASELTPDAELQSNEARLLSGVAAIVNDEVISISDVAQRARLLLITLGVPQNQENLQQVLPRALGRGRVPAPEPRAAAAGA